jgi:cbb3-type cytochrome oxidase subunit 3
MIVTIILSLLFLDIIWVAYEMKNAPVMDDDENLTSEIEE